MRARKRESFHELKNFVKKAELDKHRQAFEKIHQDENRNGLEKPARVFTERLLDGPETVYVPRKSVQPETGRDWAKDFARMKEDKEKLKEESRQKARVVQNKLLAIAGDYQPSGSREPQPGPSGFGRGRKGYSFGFGHPIVSTEEIVDIADSSDEEPTVYEDEPVCKNANMMPIGPRRNKTVNTQQKNCFDEGLMEKLKHGKPDEQAEILKKFNIIQIESPNLNNVVEVDLASDSEDETGRYSDGSSIHIEEDDMDVDHVNVNENNHVGTVSRKNMNNSFGNLNHLKTNNSRKDQELINNIVNKDLENINLNQNRMEKAGSALFLDFSLREEDDIVILSDEESVK